MVNHSQNRRVIRREFIGEDCTAIEPMPESSTREVTHDLESPLKSP